MPVYSMTGYAGAQGGASTGGQETAARNAPASRLGLEIRSVNSRFLDLTFRLPDELRMHEPALRKLLASHLKRGKVEVRVELEGAGAGALPEPGARLLQRLGALQGNVHAWLPQARPLSVAEVLRLSAGERVTDADWNERLIPLVQQALRELLAAREHEGHRLVATLRECLAQLRVQALQAKPLIPRIVEQQRQRFLERWKEAVTLTGDVALPEAVQNRALTEAAAFAIRIDVAEELARLASHLEEIERLLDEGGEIGKRLDFLIQELHREANTLGAKSAALELTRISVDMKVLIEQMREQVQNIE